ncbi:MAG: NUDIX domain-containing protein [Rhizobiales bacterium]|nr:NUDIX domain-containing protein [Hyphomicrobiales bacterium]
MTRRSAGILAYRWRQNSLEVLLGHPGGPFWSRRDEGTWSILKGEYEGGEEPETAARREFTEETGWVMTAPLEPLGEIKQRGGKVVTAYAVQADFDPATLNSNTFKMEWPPGSSRMRSFPEIDRVQWFTLADAEAKILPGQAGFLDRLAAGLPRIHTGPSPLGSTVAASMETPRSSSEQFTIRPTDSRGERVPRRTGNVEE